MKIETTKLAQNFYAATDGQNQGCGSTRQKAVAQLRSNRSAQATEDAIKEREDQES